MRRMSTKKSRMYLPALWPCHIDMWPGERRERGGVTFKPSACRFEERTSSVGKTVADSSVPGLPSPFFVDIAMDIE